MKSTKTDQSILQYVVRAASWSIVVAIAYHLTRRFTEAYYNELGIPPPMLDFEFADYLFGAGQSIVLFGTIIIAALIAKRLFDNSKPKSSQVTLRASKCRKGYVLALVVVVVILLMISYYFSTSPPDWSFSEFVYIGTLITGLVILLLLVHSQYATQLLNRDSTLQYTAAWIIAIALFGFAIRDPESFGITSARSVSRDHNVHSNFYTIQIQSDDPAFDEYLNWEQVPSGKWQTVPYLLMYESEDYVWIRTREQATPVVGISKTNISSVSVHPPPWPPPATETPTPTPVPTPAPDADGS